MNAAALTRETCGAVNLGGSEGEVDELGNEVDRAVANGFAVGGACSVVLKVILPNTQSIKGL